MKSIYEKISIWLKSASELQKIGEKNAKRKRKDNPKYFSRMEQDISSMVEEGFLLNEVGKIYKIYIKRGDKIPESELNALSGVNVFRKPGDAYDALMAVYVGLVMNYVAMVKQQVVEKEQRGVKKERYVVRKNIRREMSDEIMVIEGVGGKGSWPGWNKSRTWFRYR